MSSTAPSNPLLQYQERGWPLVPIFGILGEECRCECPDGNGCVNKGKHPNRRLAPHGVKDASLDPTVIQLWKRRSPYGNWAVATGHPLPDGGYLIILDVDPRNGGNESLQELIHLRGDLPPTLADASGGGGRHYYFRSPHPVAKHTVGPGLDLLGTGCYALLPPSRHQSGGQYTWLNDTPIAEAPIWLREGYDEEDQVVHGDWEGTTARDSLLGEAFAQAGMLGVDLPNGRVAVVCPWANQHTDGRGQGKDSSTALLPPIGGTHFGSFSCQHSHCLHRRWGDVLAALPVDAVNAAKLKYPQRPVVVTELPVANGGAVLEQPAPKDPLDAVREKIRWKYTKTGGAKVEVDVVNVITILTYDPRWQHDGKSILQFDEFAQQLRFVARPPWHGDDAPAVALDYWQDEDATRLAAWLLRYWNVNFAPDMCRAGAAVVARRWGIHPVRDWLFEQKWDGKYRVEGWLARYLGCEDTSYTRGIGQWWLISGIARIMEPGCKADHVLILEGSQGIRKSSCIEVLAGGPEWFTDTPFELGSKDSYMAIRGKWIVELSELDSLTRAESSRAKAFFSARNDTYRVPYGREAVTIARQCIFAGTVNHDQYLRDETGGRRYWPITCGDINLDALRRDQPQLWAEALVMYKSGVRWWPDTGEESSICAGQQADRNEGDAWSSPIRDWLLGGECDQVLRAKGFIEVSDILSRALGLPKSQWDKQSQIRVGKIMAKMTSAWMKTRCAVEGERLYAFKRVKGPTG